MIVCEPPFQKKGEHTLFTKVPFKSLSDNSEEGLPFSALFFSALKVVVSDT